LPSHQDALSAHHRHGRHDNIRDDWPMHAWALPDEVLKKVYRDNALKLFTATAR
jgi:hypothetical protein